MINCIFEDGGKVSLRHVTVGTIVENSNGEILLVRRAKHLFTGSNKLAIPGGFLDRDEDAETAAIREVLEETGIEVDDIKFFRVNDSPKRPREDRQNVDFIFIAKSVSAKLKDNSEVIEFLWITKNTLPEEEEFAFDHRDSIQLYFKYLENPFFLPITNYT
jgi:8-oxo-dGTP diphosphatase